jgi:hypothetical protein
MNRDRDFQGEQLNEVLKDLSVYFIHFPDMIHIGDSLLIAVKISMFWLPLRPDLEMYFPVIVLQHGQIFFNRFPLIR